MQLLSPCWEILQSHISDPPACADGVSLFEEEDIVEGVWLERLAPAVGARWLNGLLGSL